jgi:hypothetical protein
MNVYRLKLRRIKSEILYVSKEINKLKIRAFAIQEFKVNQKSDRVQQLDYEKSLIKRN